MKLIKGVNILYSGSIDFKYFFILIGKYVVNSVTSEQPCEYVGERKMVIGCLLHLCEGGARVQGIKINKES